MMTLNIWRAEWLKTRKLPLNKILFIGLLVIIGGVYLIQAILALTNPEEALESAKGMLPFPHSLSAPVQILGQLGAVLMVVFVASSIGSEYTRDTWKMVIPRHGSRLAFMLAKLLSLFVASFTLLVGMLVVGFVVGLLGSLINGLDPFVSVDDAFVNDHLRLLGVTLADSLFFGMLTLLATVLARSIIGGALIGLLLPNLALLLAYGLSRISETLPLLLPTLHLTNIQFHWGQGSQEGDLIQAFTGRTVTPETSMLVVLIYILAFLAISFRIFHRRDMA